MNNKEMLDFQEQELKEKLKKFKTELNNIIKKNNKDVITIELCRKYLEVIKNISDLKTLEIKYQNFYKELNKLEIEKTFRKRRSDFRKRLDQEEIKNSNNKQIINLIDNYRMKMLKIHTYKELDILIYEFDKDLMKLETSIYKTLLSEKKALLEDKFIMTEESYSDQETISLINICRNKLQEIKSTEDLNILEYFFEKHLKKIRDIEKQFYDVKERIRDYFFKHLNGIYKEEYQDIVEDYLEMLRDRNTLDELKEIKESFDAEIGLIDKKIKSLEEETKVKKEKAKRVCIYKFYEATKLGNYERIQTSKDILEKLLKILDATTFRDIDAFMIFISRLKFLNLKNDLEKIKFYEFSKNENVKIINQEYFDEQLKKEEVNVQGLVDQKEDNQTLRNKIQHDILFNYHGFAIEKDIKDILASLNDLMRIIDLINNMSELDLEKNYQIFANINFKNMNQTNNLLNSLKSSSDIYINNKTGELYVANIAGYLIPVDNYSGSIYLIDQEDLEKNYISVREFFQNATFINGRVVLEKIDDHTNWENLLNANEEYEGLYYYKNLMLIYNSKEPNDLTFKIPRRGIEWTLGGISYKNPIVKKYADRDLCEDDLIMQVERKIDSYRNYKGYAEYSLPKYVLTGEVEDNQEIAKKI